MAQPDNFEIFVCMNEQGDIGLGRDAEKAFANLLNHYQSRVVRTVAIQVALARPVIEVAAVDIAEDAGDTVQVKTVDIDDPMWREVKEVVAEALQEHEHGHPSPWTEDMFLEYFRARKYGPAVVTAAWIEYQNRRGVAAI